SDFSAEAKNKGKRAKMQSALAPVSESAEWMESTLEGGGEENEVDEFDELWDEVASQQVDHQQPAVVNKKSAGRGGRIEVPTKTFRASSSSPRTSNTSPRAGIPGGGVSSSSATAMGGRRGDAGSYRAEYEKRRKLGGAAGQSSPGGGRVSRDGKASPKGSPRPAGPRSSGSTSPKSDKEGAGRVSSRSPKLSPKQEKTSPKIHIATVSLVESDENDEQDNTKASPDQDSLSRGSNASKAQAASLLPQPKAVWGNGKTQKGLSPDEAT
ncbi:unnamed protein product, partial [Amoebophrya sp. A25]